VLHALTRLAQAFIRPSAAHTRSIRFDRLTFSTYRVYSLSRYLSTFQCCDTRELCSRANYITCPETITIKYRYTVGIFYRGPGRSRRPIYDRRTTLTSSDSAAGRSKTDAHRRQSAIGQATQISQQTRRALWLEIVTKQVGHRVTHNDILGSLIVACTIT
jgi:hypothetical protein